MDMKQELYNYIVKNFSILKNNDYSDKRINIIVDLIYRCYCGKQNHILYGKGELVFFLKAAQLRKISSRRWKELISPFFVLVNTSFVVHDFTRAYKFTDELLMSLDLYDIDSVKAKNNSEKNIIKINVDNGLRALILIQRLLKDNNYQSYNDVFEPKKRIKKASELRMKKFKLISLLSNTTQNIYEERNTGRLYLQSESNIQSCDTEIRRLLLSGMGYYDYDIENCHYSLLYQLLERENINMFLFPVLTRYVKSKNEFRETLSREFGVDVNKTKEILASLINSGAASFKSTCFAEMEYERVTKKIISNHIFKRLKEELKNIKGIFFEKHVKNGIFTNTVGKRLDIKLKSEGVKRNTNKSKLMAYMLQGYERKILDAVTSKYSDIVVLKIHDGWVLKKDIPAEEIAETIRKETGFSVSISKEPLTKLITL